MLGGRVRESDVGSPARRDRCCEIKARNVSIPENVVRFLRSSVNLQIGRAARMLHEHPALAESGFPAAVVLGDAPRIEAELRRDPGAAARVDLGTGRSAPHLACASRFHLDPTRAPGLHLDPARAPGLAEVTRQLLDADADIDGKSTGRRCWRPLECAATSANSRANNEPIIRLLLDRGAPARADRRPRGNRGAARRLWRRPSRPAASKVGGGAPVTTTQVVATPTSATVTGR